MVVDGNEIDCYIKLTTDICISTIALVVFVVIVAVLLWFAP